MGYIIIGILLVLLLIPVLMYNGLVGKRNQVDNIFGTMDAMLKKRWDLVPNLAATVKGYAQHEHELLEKITQERANQNPDRQGNDEKVAFDNQVSQALSRAFLAVENYPDLKASQNFLHLQRTLVELEEQISAARRAFNAAVTDYNNAVDMFPTNVVASMFGFGRKQLFAVEALERANVRVADQLG
ncbi:LemA family protein [Planctomycetota bacterium]